MQTEEKYILIDDERLYFKEKEFVQYSGKKINLEIAKENLEILHSVLEKTKIKYGLIFGTLLGAIREQNFIAHDEDIDIYILNEDRDDFLRLLREVKNYGFEVVRYHYDLLSIMRKNEYIDIYFFRTKKKFGILKLRVLTTTFECAANYLENPTRLMFLGMNMPIPNNAEELLVKMYGKDWKVPKIDYGAVPNTIYYKISALSKKLNKLPFYRLSEKLVKSLLKKLDM